MSMRPYQAGENFYNIIQTAIPDFVEVEYPTFLAFMDAFARFLEQKRTFTDVPISPEYGNPIDSTLTQTVTFGGPLYETRKFLEYRDAATTLDEFTSNFLNLFAKNFPQYSYIPLDLLTYSLRQFYQSKGTTESIKWFFRTFLNRDADVYFPREDILRASDGTWTAQRTLKVSSPLPDPQTNVVPVNEAVTTFYVGQRIQTTTGSAQVERVVTTVVGQAYNQHVIVNELTLKFDTTLGTFEPGQIVHNIDAGSIIYTRILPVISAAIVESGGSNYLPGDIVTFSEGPTGGGGYGAYGEVSAVASTALNGVGILDGGDGYITGLPVTFTSTTGSGAAAVISEIVYGEFVLEDQDGYIIAEDSGTDAIPLTLEDRNTILLELLIEPFVNATATVTLDSPDYGAATGVADLNGVSLDDSIEIALNAGNEQPFMHPWVWLDSAHTVATLANASFDVVLTSNTYFQTGAEIYTILSPLDITTSNITASSKATVLISNVVSAGIGHNELFLSNTVNDVGFDVNQLVKQTANTSPFPGLVSIANGSANVVGNNTTFTSFLKSNVHVRLGDGSQFVVRNVVNNTFLESYTLLANTTTTTYSIIPTGTLQKVTLQAQRYYGKIKTITMLATGDRYQTPPFVTADSLSAEVQEHFYYDALNNLVIPSNGQVDVFTRALLIALQDSGQVTAIKILNSGVNYTDPNNIRITIIHGPGRTGANAVAHAVLGSVTQYAGYYSSSRGFLSADKYLQSGDFYNDYTYVVRLAESFDRYRDLLLTLIHPAGFNALGYYVDIEHPPALTPSVSEELSLNSILEVQDPFTTIIYDP